MKNREIPRKPKEFSHNKDLRIKLLNEWKKLFKKIHEEIKVYLYTEEIFKDILNEIYGDISFSSEYYDEARIIIILPKEFELQYLVGLIGDRMFSHKQVLEDPLFPENYNYPCVPESFKWEKFYFDICKISEERKQEIPFPASPVFSKIHIK